MSATSIGIGVLRPMVRSLKAGTAKLKLQLGAHKVAWNAKGLHKWRATAIRDLVKNHSGRFTRGFASTPSRLESGLGNGASKFTPRTATGRSFPRASFAPGSRPSLSSLSHRVSPLAPRGPSLVSHVGLSPSPARQFSSSGAHAFRDVVLNAPIGMRALAERLRTEEERLEAHRKKRSDARILRKKVEALTKGGESKVIKSIFKREKELKKLAARAAKVAPKAVEQNRKEKMVAEFDALFPLAFEAPVKAAEADSTTYLTIPIDASYLHLLQGSPISSHPDQLLYEADPPSRPNLLADLFLDPQSSSHPQLAQFLDKLMAKGILVGDVEPWMQTPEFSKTHRMRNVGIEVVRDGLRAGVESVRLVFPARTAEDVQVLVRDSLPRGKSAKTLGWQIHSVKVAPAAVSLQAAQEDPRESTMTSSISSLPSSPLSMSTTSFPTAFHSRVESHVLFNAINQGDFEFPAEERLAWEQSLRFPVLEVSSSIDRPSQQLAFSDEEALDLSAVDNWALDQSRYQGTLTYAYSDSEDGEDLGMEFGSEFGSESEVAGRNDSLWI